MSELEHQYGLFRVGLPTYAFENLVALDVRWVGNRLGSKFPLDLRLEVEKHLLAVNVKQSWLRRALAGSAGGIEPVLRLSVRLRFCYVRYHSTEINVPLGSKYERAIIEGKFAATAKETSTGVSNSLTAAELGTKVAVSTTKVAGSVGGGLAGGFRREQKQTTEFSTSLKPDIYEVRAVPGGWRIGDPEYGDPTGPSRCLDGPYFNESVAEFPHTCEAEFLEGKERGTMTFEVTVRGGLYVERESGGVAHATEEAKAIAKMRDSVAALRLERDLIRSKASGSRSDDEMVLATVTCEFVRAAGDDDTNEATSRAAGKPVTRGPPEEAPQLHQRRRKRS